MEFPHAGELAALATAFCWTLSTLNFTGASRRVGSLAVNLIRLVLAWIFLAVEGLLVRGLVLPVDAPGKAWLWLSLSGLVGFFLGDLCLIRAFVAIGPRLTTLLMSLAPPIAAILGSLVLEERLRPLGWAGMALTLAGVSWVALERKVDGNGDARRPSAGGVALGLLAASGQAVGAVLSKLGMGSGAASYDAFGATQIRVQAGIAGFAVLLLVLGWYPQVLRALRDLRAMASTAAGAFLGSFLGVSLFLLSLQRIPTGVAQTIVSIIPVLILPFVIVLDRERVSARAAAGAAFAVIGIGLLFLGA